MPKENHQWYNHNARYVAEGFETASFKRSKDMNNFESVRQIGIAVDDLEETIKIYTEIFGCEKWTCYKVGPEELANYPQYIHGEQRDINLKVAKTFIGTLEFEFIETIYGETIQKEYLDTQPRKNGVQHISFNTNDFSSAAEFLGKKYEVISEAKTPSGWNVMFFDAYDDLGYAIEIQYALPKNESK